MTATFPPGRAAPRWVAWSLAAGLSVALHGGLVAAALFLVDLVDPPMPLPVVPIDIVYAPSGAEAARGESTPTETRPQAKPEAKPKAEPKTKLEIQPVAPAALPSASIPLASTGPAEVIEDKAEPAKVVSPNAEPSGIATPSAPLVSVKPSSPLLPKPPPPKPPPPKPRRSASVPEILPEFSKPTVIFPTATTKLTNKPAVRKPVAKTRADVGRLAPTITPKPILAALSEGGVEKLSAAAGDALIPVRPSARPIASRGNRPPEYPARARRRGWEGRVVLRVRVAITGRALSVVTKYSSGYRVLDKAAREAVREWRFSPGRLAGVPVVTAVDVPIVFRLK